MIIPRTHPHKVGDLTLTRHRTKMTTMMMTMVIGRARSRCKKWPPVPLTLALLEPVVQRQWYRAVGAVVQCRPQSKLLHPAGWYCQLHRPHHLRRSAAGAVMSTRRNAPPLPPPLPLPFDSSQLCRRFRFRSLIQQQPTTNTVDDNDFQN